MPAEHTTWDEAAGAHDLLTKGPIVAGLRNPQTSISSQAGSLAATDPNTPSSCSKHTISASPSPRSNTAVIAGEKLLSENVTDANIATEPIKTLISLDNSVVLIPQAAVTCSTTSPAAETDTNALSSTASPLQATTILSDLEASLPDSQISLNQTSESATQLIAYTSSVSLPSQKTRHSSTKLAEHTPSSQLPNTLRATPSILSPIEEEQIETPTPMTEPTHLLQNEPAIETSENMRSDTSTPSDTNTIVPEGPAATSSLSSDPIRPPNLPQSHRQIPQTSILSGSRSSRQISRAVPQPPPIQLRRISQNQNSSHLHSYLAAVNPSPRLQFTPEIRQSTIGQGQLASSLLSEPLLFSYNRDNSITRCWLPICGQPTASNDGNTVICPRCTEYSYVRYCSTEHLHKDFYRHYTTSECGRRYNALRIDESTIMPLREPVREFIKITDPTFESLERVRQAIFRSQPPLGMELADYFIFADVDNLLTNEPPETDVRSFDVLRRYRGTGSLIAAVNMRSRAQEFRSVLVQCLELGYAAGTINLVACGLLFVWLKEELRGIGVWSEDMVTRVCFAMQLEFGYKAPAHLCGI